MFNSFTASFHVWPYMGHVVGVVKKQFIYMWPFGPACWVLGGIFVDRKSPNAKDTLNNALEIAKSKNQQLLIYPEGTRRNTGEIHEFKKGAFHIAIKGQFPIVPLVTSSLNKILDTKNKKFHSGTLIIEILPPIPTAGLTENDVDRLIEKTRMTMIDKFERLNKEVENM